MIYTSRQLRPRLLEMLQKLRPGQRIRVRQRVRVGLRSWTAEAVGVFRHVDSLATGLATQRDPHDDFIVGLLHFTKDNGELSSVALDEHTEIELLPDVPADGK